ncbi:8-oxoguanine DNA glycosylase isoform X3 [Rhodnius prolixus]|uniref:8-oxoguanine DNA glycosylase isoform X3 n=1 Tax=Rhodnius prolixus TaxID=13249 RepID=UPI003D18B1C3
MRKSLFLDDLGCRMLVTRQMARIIFVNKRDLNLKMMLEGGQCFRWKSNGSNEWTGVLQNLLWVIKQFDYHIEYEVFGDKGSLNEASEGVSNSKQILISNQDKTKNMDQVLIEYLRLDHEVNNYYGEWSEKDLHFKKVAKDFCGIRILSQDPVENMFSFICSSNNNIKRITHMVMKLCELFGEKIADLNGCSFYSFPLISALTQTSVEEELRKAGFGYRAKYVHQSAKMLHSLGGINFLNRLKSDCFETARKELMKFPGIGAKVADCICLMSLGHLEAVPVDTHVFQIASKFYLPHLNKVKSVTPKIYDEIGDHFRKLYGPLAGWAHAVLFCADLNTFGNESGNSRLPNKISKRLFDKHAAAKSDSSSYRENIEIEEGTLECSRKDLNLRITLNSGQSYRWQEVKTDVWRGVYNDRVWTLYQSDVKIDFTSTRHVTVGPPEKKGIMQKSVVKQLLFDYFRMDFPLKEYYQRWAMADQHFCQISNKFHGLRMIKQDIVENLFAFICSSNNTINRTRSMVETLCKLYGEEIVSLDGNTYHSFPSVIRLAEETVESELRSSNFGFRASYIRDSARYILEHGNQLWLHNLCQLSYEDAKTELIKLPGVGAKVADCICLTALDHLDVIPVDTHVYQLATKYYLPHLHNSGTSKRKRSISPSVYQEIGDSFRKLFGDFAGWAHTVLFCSELRQHMDLR